MQRPVSRKRPNGQIGANGVLSGKIHRVRKKSLRFTIHNFNKFRYIFILLGTNHPETALY